MPFAGLDTTEAVIAPPPFSRSLARTPGGGTSSGVSNGVTNASSTDTGGASSLTMVPTPSASSRKAPVTPNRLRTKVSSASGVRSPLTITSMVCVVVPGGKVNVPAAGW